jgi:hypothetical protein
MTSSWNVTKYVEHFRELRQKNWFMRESWVGFCNKKNFASNRNEIRFACFFSLLFTSNFSLPTKAKLLHRIFALVFFQQFFISLHYASDFLVLLQSETK